MIMNDIIIKIKESQKIAILPHVFADGDAIGSSLALAIALKRMNKDVTIFLEEEIPNIYAFVPSKELTKLYKQDKERFDLTVSLDTGDLGRLGKRQELFKETEVTVNIDHHQTNSMFASYNYVETESAAVGEIVYQLLKLFNIEIDNEIATCLYIALATDTGGFRYSNTTPKTHQIAADLIRTGINIADISHRVFDTVSKEKVKLTGAAINSLELLEDGKVSLITISDEIMKETGAKEEDCDGIVNIGRNINGVEVSLVLRQRENGEVKINFRSNTYVDVATIANAFGGGGHKRASGCSIKGDLKEVETIVLNEIKKVL